MNSLIEERVGFRTDPCGKLATDAAAALANSKFSIVFIPFNNPYA
jgi:hypothetical protein